jgi:hypothetical protein
MNMQQIQGFVLSLVLIALIAGAGAIALNEFRDSDSITANDHAYNVTTSGLEGIDNTMDFADTWGVIVGVVALITIVVGGFMMFRRGT